MRLIASSVLSLMLTGCLTAQSRDASVPSELVGKWYTGSSSSLMFLDRRTSISDAAGGNGTGLEIKADGTFAKSQLSKVGLYGCSVMVFGYQKGNASANGGTLTFNGESIYVSYKDSCNPHTNSEKNGKPDSQQYQYELKTDDGGRKLLCLSDGNKEECFRKETE